MGARTTFVVMAVVVATSVAQADAPKPKPVDISEYKDKLIVLTDPSGGTYAVYHAPTGGESIVFYGDESGKLYRQRVVGGGANGSAWDISTYSPRVWRNLRASVMYEEDGTYRRYCADNEADSDTPLTRLGDEAAKKVLTKSKFLTTATMYYPYGLARDEKGVYYYVDQLVSEYGGKGYRLWVGKKGRMKQVPLADVSDDTDGAVFSTKTGDLHLVVDVTQEQSEATWTRGEKSSKLKSLDTFNNTWLIHSELGVYKFMGTLCENQRPPPDGAKLPQ
jgi:hypothetical protein